VPRLIKHVQFLRYVGSFFLQGHFVVGFKHMRSHREDYDSESMLETTD